MPVLRLNLVLVVVAAVQILAACSQVPRQSDVLVPPAPAVYSGPEPLVVIDDFGGHLWNITPNIEQPSFVLYGDGTVIVQRETASPSTYVTSTLQSEVVARLIADIDRAALEAFDGEILSARTASDQGSEVLHVRRDNGTYIKVVLYGWWSEPRPGAPGVAPLPDPINRAFCAVTHLELPPATPWRPEQFEVYFQDDILNPRSTPVDWPVSWPTPQRESPDQLWQTVRLSDLDPTEVTATLGSPGDYLSKRIRIGPTLLAVRYRPIFPFEEKWRRVTGRASE
jgi:hypothetical protein